MQEVSIPYRKICSDQSRPVSLCSTCSESSAHTSRLCEDCAHGQAYQHMHTGRGPGPDGTRWEDNGAESSASGSAVVNHNRGYGRSRGRRWLASLCGHSYHECDRTAYSDSHGFMCLVPSLPCVCHAEGSKYADLNKLGSPSNRCCGHSSIQCRTVHTKLQPAMFTGGAKFYTIHTGWSAQRPATSAAVLMTS